MSGVELGAPTTRHQRVTHRLEAFSDIVIGFSLALLTLSLTIPAHAVDFVQRPTAIVAFLITFVLIVRFWWLHFVIFEHYFEPNRLTITCNFIALASLMLQIFSLQLFLHFVPLGEGIVAARIYFALFALSYGSLCVMLALGLRYRWMALTPSRRRFAVQIVLRLIGTVAGCVAGDILSTKDATNVMVDVGGHQETVATIPSALVLLTLLGSVLGFVASRVVPRFLRGLNSDADGVAGVSAPVRSDE